MKNATYVDQSDTIRTLTEEELAVVSGGFNLQAMADRFKHSTIYDYIPKSRNLPAWAWRNAFLPVGGMFF